VTFLPEATQTGEPPASVGIVGLGFIGASLCGALRGALPGVRIVGVARSAGIAARARADGLCDEAGIDARLVGDVEVVVLCTPVDVMPSWLAAHTQDLPVEALVTDTGSTKAWVVERASALLGAGRFCGGHPMAGRERSGYDAREPGLFDGCTWVLAPADGRSLERAGPWSAALTALGARVEVMDAVDHDAAVALVSHLPFAVSAALMRCVAGHPAWAQGSRLAVTGLRDAVRLAGGDPAMYAAIAVTNADPLRRCLDAFEAELGRLRDVLRHPESSRAYFEQARAGRADWLETRRRAGRPVP